MGRQCGLSLFYQACLCFFFNLFLSQMYDFTSMIFAVLLWGSEVANSKTEIHLTNTAVEVGMQRRINAMSLLLNARVTLLRGFYMSRTVKLDSHLGYHQNIKTTNIGGTLAVQLK